MPCERLGFAFGTDDVVSAQHTIEYMDTPRSRGRDPAGASSRGGRALVVMHHDHSILFWNARASLAHSALVLEETSILRKLRRNAAAERQSKAAAARTWAELSAAATELRQAAA